MGLSIGLDTAVKALRAHQLAVDVASHNVANVGSPGFSRQRVLLRPMGVDGSDHFTRDALLGRAGFGVMAKDVNRVRDIFLDFQVRQVIGSKTESSVLARALSQAEFVFNDPTDDGISALLSKFWSAWHDLVNDPESAAARTTIVNSTETLATRLQGARQELLTQRADQNLQVSAIGDKINAAAAEIAQLNFQIKQVELSGDIANDLRDRRDLLLDELASLADISYSEQPDKSVLVYLGNHELVTGNSYRAVAAIRDPAQADMTKLVFATDQADVIATAGELRGVLDVRDRELPNLIAKLDRLAGGLINSVNSLHSRGFGIDNPPSTGLAFFVGTNASDIALNPALRASPDAIAAAAGPGLPGDGSIALAIADLELAPNMPGGFAATSLVAGETLTPGVLTATFAGPAGSITGISGNYAGGVAGSWAITDDGAGNLSAVFTPAGGVPQPPVLGAFVAMGTDNTLIPGVTLQFGAAPVAGTQTITVAPAGGAVTVAGVTAGPTLQAGDYFVTANGPNLDLRFGSTTGPVVGTASLADLPTGTTGIVFNNGPDTIATVFVSNPNATAVPAAQVQDMLLAAGNDVITVEDSADTFYAKLVSVLGADVKAAQGVAESSDLMVSHLESLRQSVSGVNLDEEMTNLNASQHAYNAAARVITTIDDMLDTLINRTGVTR